MARYLVLKTLPKGQLPGETVELNDDEAFVFMSKDVEAVRPVAEPIAEETKARRRYQRRDLVAED